MLSGGETASARGASVEASPATTRERQKRWLYLLAIAASVGILIASWAFRDPGDAFIAYVYPVLAAVVAVAAVLLHTRRVPVASIERFLLVALTAGIMARLAWHYHASPSIEGNLVHLAGGHYWAVALLLVAGFVMLDQRPALLLGVGVWVTATAIAISGLAPAFAREEVGGETLLVLARVHGFLLVLIALVATVGFLRAELRRSEERSLALDRLATTDTLTGLANRRAARAELERLCRQTQRYERPVAVVIVDLDHFKRINDQHGHAAGDEALIAAAAMLRRHTRSVDTIARWGGEEFLVIAPETPAPRAAQLAERMRVAFADRTGNGPGTTASFGVAELRPDETPDDVLRRADAALYEAKRAGRDRVVTA